MNLATDEAQKGMQVIVVDIVSHLAQGSAIDGISYHSHAPFFLQLNCTDVVIEPEPAICISQPVTPTAKSSARRSKSDTVLPCGDTSKENP